MQGRGTSDSNANMGSPVVRNDRAKESNVIINADRVPPLFLDIATDPEAIEHIGAKMRMHIMVEPVIEIKRDAVAMAIIEKMMRFVHISIQAAQTMHIIGEINSAIGESHKRMGRESEQAALIAPKTNDGALDEARASPFWA